MDVLTPCDKQRLIYSGQEIERILPAEFTVSVLKEWSRWVIGLWQILGYFEMSKATVFWGGSFPLAWPRTTCFQHVLPSSMLTNRLANGELRRAMHHSCTEHRVGSDPSAIQKHWSISHGFVKHFCSSAINFLLKEYLQWQHHLGWQTKTKQVDQLAKPPAMGL